MFVWFMAFSAGIPATLAIVVLLWRGLLYVVIG
jgi:hypothetical protein